MARLLYSGQSLPLSCHMVLAELGVREAIAPYPSKGEEDPPVGIGPGSLFVATRCAGRGDVGLEIWAGDPSIPEGWHTLFEGNLETKSNGFSVGEAADSYHIAAPPGQYRVRVDVHRDDLNEVDSVRFVFPRNEELVGQAIES